MSIGSGSAAKYLAKYGIRFHVSDASPECGWGEELTVDEVGHFIRLGAAKFFAEKHGVSIEEYHHYMSAGGPGGAHVGVRCRANNAKGKQCGNYFAYAHSLRHLAQLNIKGGYCHLHAE